MDSEEVVKVYFQHWATNSPDLFWAYEQVNETLARECEPGWSLVLLLVRDAPNDAALSYVAAGPLEDWICNFGEQDMQRVSAAAKDPKFGRALAGVWGESRMPKSVAQALHQIRQS